MNARHTLETPGAAGYPYWLAYTESGWQTTVWDLLVRLCPHPIDILDNGVIVYGEAPEQLGTFCGAPIYTHPRPIVYRDDYRPRHAS